MTGVTLDSVLARRASGALTSAICDARRLMVLQPATFEVVELVGILCCESLDYDRGLAILRFAVHLSVNEKKVFSNLAVVYRRLGRSAEALDALARATALDPACPTISLQVAADVARTSSDVTPSPVALTMCKAACLLNPQSADTAHVVATIFIRVGKPSEALEAIWRSLALSPGIVSSLITLASISIQANDFLSAERMYTRASNVAPEDHDPPYYLSLLQLRLGVFKEGWRNYEHRWLASIGKEQLSESKAVRDSRPQYTGRYRPKRLLIWAEQGIGDEIMFGSLLDEFRVNCDELLVQVDPRLIDIFSRSLPNIRFFGFDKPISPALYDEQLPIGSLGKFLRPSRESFAGKGGRYLSAAKGAAERLRSELRVAKNELLIGICWRAVNPENRQMRSIPLEALLSALNFPGLRFLNLQYANVDKELSLLDASLRGCLLHHRDIDLTKNLDGVAGLIEACDLVISVGNAVAHLSGALGQRTWVLLPQIAGWRWLHGSTTCGWYESVRLFRQERRGDWNGVLSDLRAAIDHEIRGRK